MTDVIISGSANTLILIEGDSLSSIRPSATGPERTSRQPHELPYLLGDARDLVFLYDTDEATALKELAIAHEGVLALNLALMLCDPKTSERAAPSLSKVVASAE